MPIPPPVVQGLFSLIGTSLSFEASGKNVHRRADVHQLEEHIDENNKDKGTDKPAHWYEAQLVHYGLPPSKDKDTAKMRLYDAVKAGRLAVPVHLKELELNLKKEWLMIFARTATPPMMPSSRPTQPAAPQSAATPPTTAAAPSKKRKAPDSEPKPASTRSKRTTASSSRGGVTAATSAAETPITTTASTSTPRIEQMVRREDLLARGAAAAPRAIETARSGGDSSPAGTGRPIQTARRGGGFGGAATARGGAATTAGIPGYHGAMSGHAGQGANDDNDPPPPYSEIDYNRIQDWNNRDEAAYDRQSYGNPPLPRFTRELGLLNGRYEVYYPNETVGGPSSHSLIITLDRHYQIWGKIDLGDLTALLYGCHQLLEGSEALCGVKWLGHRVDPVGGEMEFYGISRVDPGAHFLQFRGGGEIRGRLSMGHDVRDFVSASAGRRRGARSHRAR